MCQNLASVILIELPTVDYLQDVLNGYLKTAANLLDKNINCMQASSAQQNPEGRDVCFRHFTINIVVKKKGKLLEYNSTVVLEVQK